MPLAIVIALLFAESSMNNLQSVNIVVAFPIGAIIVMISVSFMKDAKKYTESLDKKSRKRLTMLAMGNKLVSRAVWIELLRILACFCVILLHISSKGWNYAGINSDKWIYYEVLNALSRIGVCIFVMISGSLFLGNKRGSSIETMRKYILKILRLIAIWSIAYFILRLIIGDTTITNIPDLFSQILYGYYHLWYLWMILGLYVITPILHKVVSDEKMCRYLLLLCMLVCWIPEMLTIVPAWSKFVQTIFQDKMYLFLPMGYTGYYILGYYLCNYRIKKKWIFMVTGTLGMIYGVVGGALYARNIGEPTQITYNNLTLATVCYSAMIFISLREKLSGINFSEKMKKIIFTLGDSTLGIYLMHVVFVRGFSDQFMMKTNYRYPMVSILMACMIFIVCFSITEIVKKIPVVGRWIV